MDNIAKNNLCSVPEFFEVAVHSSLISKNTFHTSLIISFVFPHRSFKMESVHNKAKSLGNEISNISSFYGYLRNGKGVTDTASVFFLL